MSVNSTAAISEPIQDQARKIWEELMTLDRSRHLREELRASGIAERRIQALYPLDFADFIEGLQSRITAETLREVTAPIKLQELMDSMRGLMYEFPHIDRAARALAVKSNFTEALASFMRHIDSCLPRSLADGDARAETARRAGILLWLTFSIRDFAITDNADGQLSGLVEETDRLLVGVNCALLKS